MKSLFDYITESSSSAVIKKVEREIKSCGCKDNSLIGFAIGVVFKNKELNEKIDVIAVEITKDGFETAGGPDETGETARFEEAVKPGNGQTAGIVMYSKTAKHRLIIINTRAREIRFGEMKTSVKLNGDVYDTKTLFSALKENNITADGEKFSVVV